VWALVKKYVRTVAPRMAVALRRAARHVVDADHCARFFAHIGHVTSSA
jgi:hypothetical protein